MPHGRQLPLVPQRLRALAAPIQVCDFRHSLLPRPVCWGAMHTAVTADESSPAHGVFVLTSPGCRILLPTRYKTRLCSFGRACSRPCCFFAHDASELRYVPMSEEGKEQEEREQLVQLMMAQDAAGSMSMATGSNDLMGMAGTLGSTRQLPGMHMQGCAGMAHMQGAPQGQRLHHSLSQGLSGTGGYGELGLSSAASASLEELMSGMRVSLPGSGSDQHMGMPVMRMSVPGTGHDQQLAMAGLRMTYSGTPSEQQQQQQLGASMHVSMPQPQVQQAMGGYDGMGRHNRAPPPRSHSSLAAPSASSSSASASMHAGLRQHHQDQVDAASLLLGLQQSLNMATDGAWAAAGADMPNARLSDPGTAHAHINPLRHLSRISDSGQTLGLATPAIRDLENLLTSALAGAASLSNGATSGGTSGGALRSPAPDQQQQQDAGLASQRSSPSAGSGSQVLSADQQDGSRSSGNLQPSQQPGGTQAGANPADEYVKGLVTQLQQQGIVTSKQQLVDSLTQLLSQLLHSA